MIHAGAFCLHTKYNKFVEERVTFRARILFFLNTNIDYVGPNYHEIDSE